jgi:hypothetical protein
MLALLLSASKLMGWAYFDETVAEEDAGSAKKRSAEMIVGGCIAPQSAWDAFNLDWARALTDEGVSAFHAKDFYAFRGEFEWLTNDGEREIDRHNAFRDRLGEIVAHHIDEAIGFPSSIKPTRRGVRQAYEQAVVAAIHFSWGENGAAR